tara:strand:+ start:9681 stop:10358 length:678 start_codon:yes stop_codon:yes gene_type:complete
MKKVLVILVLLLSNGLSSQTSITKIIGDFKIIKIYNGINIELIRSDEQKIEITGEKAERVKVKNNNGTLKISLKFPDLSADGKVDIKLFYNKDINVIDGNEGATITGKEIDQLQLEVKAQERAFINLVIKTKHLKVRSSSGGIIKLTGSSKNQDVNLDLYGVYHGYGLKISENTSIKAGSGSKAEVNAGETLNAKVSFGGSIFYKGNPEVVKDKKVAGGIIKQMN